MGMAKRILVTGVSGFIAKHVALLLLQQGYSVCGTIRSLNKAGEVKRALDVAGADTSRLSFAAADLTVDDGWDEAAKGCDGIMHIASPLPVAQPRDRDALTPAARDGALRVIRAGRSASRIIMTSSMAAMMYRPNRPPVVTVSENDWTDIDWRALSAYVVSKTAAERAAWDLAVAGGFKHRLTTVNPGLVLGPPLDDDIGASLDLIKMLMTGAYPAVPPAAFPIVDVRDVAAVHVNALEAPETGGRRLIAVAESLSLKAVAETLREAFPERARKIPARVLPAWLVRVLAVADRNLASVLPDLGVEPRADAAYVTALTGVKFRPAREAIIDAGRALARLNAI
jgi:dihydroflavonol-4-reductase